VKLFDIKPEIMYGENSIEKLQTISFGKVCIVTDKRIGELGLLKILTDILDAKKVNYQIFFEVVPDPTTAVIEKGLMSIIQFKPDALIAIGGGSSIDTAKAIIYYCIKLKENFIKENTIEKPYFIAIPTTAGTGSEVTEYAVITNSDTLVKTPIADKIMLPDLAILDPQFTLSAPDFITADTGMDALTHSIEAYVSRNANEFSDAYALQSIKLIYENLLTTYKDGSNMTGRDKLMIASCMAGISFNNSSLGINHSIAHTIGSNFHLPHGKSNAIILPYVIEYNMKDPRATKRYSEIAIHVGLDFKDIKINAQSLAESIKMLNKALGIPGNLTEAGIDKSLVIDKLDSLALQAMKDMCTSGNPIKPSIDDLKSIFLTLVN